MILKAYKWLSFLPILSFILAYIYVSKIPGWGAFWAAGVLLYPIILSGVCVFLGCVIVALKFRQKEPNKNIVSWIFLSSLPLIIFFFRWAYLEFKISFL